MGMMSRALDLIVCVKYFFIFFADCTQFVACLIVSDLCCTYYCGISKMVLLTVILVVI